jgi:hypothetical protein
MVVERGRVLLFTVLSKLPFIEFIQMTANFLVLKERQEVGIVLKLEKKAKAR